MHIDIRDILILSTVPGVGPGRLRALVNHFKDTKTIIRATARELASAEGMDRRTASAIAGFFRNSGTEHTRFVDDQLRRLEKAHGRIVTFWDKDYPENLKKIYDPPPFLFVSGSFTDEDKYSVAIVGTRDPSSYGTQMAELFATELAGLGIPVISGLARGVDTVAHTAVVKSGGRTVAVIGSGIDVIYPSENAGLVKHMQKDGALVSEYLMGTKPDAGNFPRRNRIISGISIATIIVETGLDGGAMITAKTALEQNRDVFAIPGPVNEKRKSGTNFLIKNGNAVLLESMDDLLNELGPRLGRLIGADRPRQQKPLPTLTLFEQKICDVMDEEPMHIDALSKSAGLSTSDTLVHLLSLEFKGAVKQKPGKMFLKVV